MDVHVDGDAVARHLDIGRHGDGRPRPVIEPGLPEIGHAPGVVGRVMVFPIAIERAVERGFGALAIGGELDAPGRRASGQITIVACGGWLLRPVSLGFCQSLGVAAKEQPRAALKQVKARQRSVFMLCSETRASYSRAACRDKHIPCTG